MLWVLSSSSVTVLQPLLQQPKAEMHAGGPKGSAGTESTVDVPCYLPQLALPQLALALAAVTSFHVQVINRLSSGYPIWYLVVATAVAEQGAKGCQASNYTWVVRWSVVYAITQGLLFANFLPPA
jgi:GPI mannosyltransferase 2